MWEAGGMSNPKLPVLVAKRSAEADEATIAALAAAGSSAVSDALGKAGNLSGAIRATTRNTRMAGMAVTVVTSPNDNLVPYLALKEVRAGDILVVATGGVECTCALLGGTIIGHLKNAGVRGVVTDGLVRDLDELEAIGLPVYAAGRSTRAPSKVGGGAINVPVAIGGLVVQPGDVVVADRDGVTIVPSPQAGIARSGVEAVLAREARMMGDVGAGAVEPYWMREGVHLAAVTVGPLKKS
jgi:4-hydroxy-4-methyl-2-oxoglutarate aldolase